MKNISNVIHANMVNYWLIFYF